MRNLLNISTNSENSYFSILKNILELLSDVQTATPEGMQFTEAAYSKFNDEINKNACPLLYISGTEMKEKLKTFVESDPNVFDLGSEISALINAGDYNCLINICAEEHYKNNGNPPEWLEQELNGSSEEVRSLILDDVFGGLDSELYHNIKQDLINSGEISVDETADTYNSMIDKIQKYIVNVVPDTIDGQKFLNENISKIFESKTPVLELKEFKTNAQQIVSHDAKMMDIVKFINKNVKDSPTLNILINIAKEEHMQQNLRANQPAEDETIKALEQYWQAGDSEIEQAVRNGIFNKLKSNLLMDLKSDLIPDSPETPIIKITEKTTPIKQLLESIQDLVVYNPIGVLWEDKENNQQYAFTGQDILQIQQTSGEDTEYVKSNIPVEKRPANLQKILTALDQLSYDPQSKRFGLAMPQWDFKLVIEENGHCHLIEDFATTEVAKEDLKSLLGETLSLLSSDGTLSDIDLNQLKNDADNFILIAYNFDKLIMFDDLYQIQNLNENTYVILNESIFDLDNLTLKMVAGTNTEESMTFKSYNEMVFEIHKNIGLRSENSVNRLFTDHLQNENSKLFDRQNKIGKLKSEQEALNKEITNKQNLLTIASEDSPAYERLVSDLNKLNTDLDQNLTELNLLINDWQVLQQ